MSLILIVPFCHLCTLPYLALSASVFTHRRSGGFFIYTNAYIFYPIKVCL